MASENSGIDRKQFICGICIENYTTPRYLPTCGHTFCENCLLTYASNLQQQGSKLECPVCRKPHSLPENTQVTLEWIQTLPLNSVIVKMMESGSESAEERTAGADRDIRRECDPCKERGEPAVGLKFCMDCQEVFCKTCTDFHKSFKMSRHHRLIDIKEMSAEASRADFFTSFTKCPNHPEREVEFFCKAHDAVFCTICFKSTHKQCDTDEVSSHDYNDAKLKEESEKLTSQMKDAVDHLNMLKTVREENKKDLKKKLKAIREEIEQVRNQMVILMDKVVRHVSEVTKQIELENEDRLDKEVSKVSKIKELTEERVALLDTITQHGSERHQFISAHLMKAQLEEISRKISEEDELLRNIDVELKLADDFRCLIENTDVEKLAQVKVIESESRHKHLTAVSNYLRDRKLVRVAEHTVCPNAGHYPLYWGIAIHKDGRVILSDSCRTRDCGYLCLYNPVNGTMQKFKMNRPLGATQIDDTHIAVSFLDDKTISIMNVGNELKVEKTFKTQSEPKCIVALSNDHLAVAWDSPPAFGVVDISGTEIVQKMYFDQDKRGRKLKFFSHVAVDEMRHHVIQPCSNDQALYCFDFTGEPVFRYTNPGLGYPQGVALDKCGNIYVCDYSNPGSIHKLSPAGEPISIIKEGVPSHPYAICSDNTGTGFWVTQLNSSRDKVVYFRLEENTET